MKHQKYLKYIIKHKQYVFIECVKMGIPLTGIFHDWSKFRPSEWFPYANYFFGKKSKYTEAKFNFAWLLHQKRNKHHWEYWVLRGKNGKVKVFPMPLRYRKEMLADWIGTGKAKNNKNDVVEWYLNNKHRIILHQHTRRQIERELGIDPLFNQPLKPSKQK